MLLYVSCDADDAGKLIGRARLADDVEEVRRTSARLDRGLEILKSWALSVGGSVVEAGGDECSLEIPADHIGELPAVREQYADAVKCTLSVGVGVRLAESAKALYAAKLRGKDQIVFYSPEVDELLEKESKGDQSEADKMRAEYLDKAEMLCKAGAMRAAAFRHKLDGKVVETGSYHNIEPWLQGGSIHGQYKTGPWNSSDWEAGFVTHDGQFLNREEAAKHVGAQLGRHPITGQQRTELDSSDLASGLKKAAPAMNAGAHAGFAGVSEAAAPSKDQPVPSQGDHEEAQVALDALGLDEGGQSPETTHAAADFERQLHDEAWKGEEDDMKGSVDKRGRLDQVKQRVAQALQLLKLKAPVLEQVRQVDPDAYKATMALVQSVIALAREAGGEQLGKAEGVKDGVRHHMKRIQSVLSQDLLKPEYQGSKHCLSGHCYVASEALYHLLGGKEAGWTPHVVQHEGGPHWFLKHGSGRIADLTAAQFQTPPPYERGREQGFLTYPVPSDRARQVMERMLTEQSLSPEDAAGITGEKQLAKMAIANIPRGRRMKAWEGYDDRTSYKHVLSPQQRLAGYSMHVVRAPTSGDALSTHRVHLFHDGDVVGNVGFAHDPDSRTIHVKYSEIHDGHRGKGLGTAMYEAAYAHARHALGATHVVGEEHSTSAKRVHESLSRKHGMFYEPHDDSGEGDENEEPFDGRFNGYRYAIKSEPADDSLSKAVKATAKKPQNLAPPPASEREELVHYSVKPGLKTIGVDHMGTGAPGAEYKQGIPGVGRAYYYRAGSAPEPLVTQGAKARYIAHLDPAKHRLYDLGSDPEGLRAPARERFLSGEGLETPEDTFLDAVKGKGYYGYHNSASSMPHVVALFHAHPVSKGEDLGKVEVKPPTERWAYHGTDPTHLPGIRRMGLIPNRQSGDGPQVYIADDEKTASGYGNTLLRFPWPESAVHLPGHEGVPKEWAIPHGIREGLQIRENGQWSPLSVDDLDKSGVRLPPQPVGASIAQAPSGAAGSAAAVNKIKVQHSDGSVGTKQVTAGVIRSMDPSEHGTSSRSPNSK